MKKSVLCLLAALAMMGMSCNGGSTTGSSTGGDSAVVEVPEFEKLDERATLEKIFEALNGKEWSEYNAKGWCTDAPLGEWKGVKVDESGNVVELNISDNKASGAVPAEIQNLESLKVLQIFLNNFSVAVSDPFPANIFNIESLNDLSLTLRSEDSANDFSIPENINLPNLTWLTLIGVKGELKQVGTLTNLKNLVIEGTADAIPDEIANCKNLGRLDWTYNGTSAKPINSAIAKLSNLEQLTIKNSEAQEEKIPDFIWDIKTLTKLDLEHVAKNQGELPGEKIAQLQGLTGVALNFNGITKIPSEFFDLPKIGLVNLSNNNISGTIPDNVGNATTLTGLYFDHNPNLTGSLPESMGKLEKLSVVFMGNTGLNQNVPASVKNLPKYDKFEKNLFK